MCGIRPGSVPGGYLGENNSSTVQFTSGRTFSGGFEVEEGFVEFDVEAVASVNALDVRFVTVASGEEARTAKRFGKICGEAFVVLRMEVMFKRMCGEGVGKAE